MNAEATLARAGWQPPFRRAAERAELLGLAATWPLRAFRLHVLRNHPFEFVARVLKTFLAYAGWEAQNTYSATTTLSASARHERRTSSRLGRFERYGLPQVSWAEWFGRA